MPKSLPESEFAQPPDGIPPAAFSEGGLPVSRESVHFIRRLMHLAPDIIYLYDLRTQRLTYVNQRLTDVLGYTSADLATNREALMELILEPKPADLDAFITGLYAAALNDETIEYECTVRHKNGSARVLRTRGSILRRDGRGLPLELLGISEDITAERAALNDLRRREAQLAESQRQFQYGSWEWEVGTDLVRWSDELVRIFGYDPARISGPMPFTFYLDHIPADERARFEALTSQSIAAHQPLVEFEHTIITPAGQRKRLCVRGTVVREAESKGGKVTAFRGTSADVTAGHEAAERLRQGEALLRETETLFHYGSWEWEVGASTVRWSEGLFRLLGYDPGNWPDGRVPETQYGLHLAEPDATRYRERVTAALVHRSVYEFDHWVLTRQGIRRRVRVRGSVRDGDEPLRLVGTVADVTAEYDTAERFREDEAMRNDVERFFSQGTWVRDLTGAQDSMYWSDGNARLFGYEPEEIPGGRVSFDLLVGHIHPDDREAFLTITRNSIKKREPYSTVECRIVTKSGETKHLMHRARLVLDPEGRPLRYVGTNVDVTDERRLANQLSRSEELNRRVNEISPDFIGLFNVRTSQTQYVGRHLRQLLGYAESDVRKHGGNLLFAVEESDWDKIREFQARVPSLTDGEFLTYQVWLRTNDRQRVCVRSRVTVFSRDEVGLPLELMVITQDVTELEEKSEALRRSESLNRKLVEFSPDFTHVHNLQTGESHTVGRHLYDWLGYSQAEYEAQGNSYLFAFAYPEDIGRRKDALARALLLPDGAYIATESRLRTKDGRIVTLQNRVTVFSRDAAGRPLELMSVSQDVTAQETQAEALRQSEAFNRRIIELSPDFVNVHNLRTGLTRYLGRSLRERLGYTDGEVDERGGSIFFALETDRDREIIRRNNERIPALADGEYLDHQVNLLDRGGKRVVIRVYMTVLRRDADGRVEEILVVIQDATAQETQAEQLRRSEAFNRRLLELSPDAIGLFDLQTRRSRYVSAVTLPQWFGYAPEEVEALGGNLLGQFWDKAGKAEFEAGFARALRTMADGEATTFTMKMRRKDGTLLVLFVRVAIIRRNADGRPLEVMSIYQDVTATDAAAEALRKTQAVLSESEKALRMGTWDWNVATGDVLWSAGQWRIFGYAATDTQPTTLERFYQHVHPGDAARLEAMLAEAATGHQPFQFEYRAVTTESQVRYIQGRGVPVFDGQGRLSRMVGNNLDVTDEKRSAELLEKQEYLLREAETLLNFGSWEWDVTTGEILWSEGLYAVFGYGPDDRPDRITLEVYQRHLRPDDRERATRRNAEVMREKGPFEDEYRILTPGGEERWLHEKGVVVTDDQGEVRQLMGSTADVTELRRYQTELEQRVADLHRSNADLEQFAYVASHDLQEPLRKITSFGDRLARKHADGLGTDGRVFLDRMVGAAARMQELIDNLLNFSRVTRNVDHFAPTDLNAVLRGVLGDLELKINEKGAFIDLGELPVVDALPGQMQQLIQNLLGNAIKFTRPGVAPRVRVQAESVSADEMAHYGLFLRKKYVKICVEDNGIGFEPQYAGKIFDIFQRLHGRSEYEGTGIGLATVKKIVENHRGAVYAESTPGRGARFTVLLPVTQRETD